MRALFGLLLLCLTPAAAVAEDWTLLTLQADSRHQGSKVWSGYFRGPNGRDYNAAEFYRPTKPLFSATGVLALDADKPISWLVPLAVDAGYEARLYQAEPLAAIGFGTALRFGRTTAVSFRVDNLLVVGGKISEQPCYDGYRRRYHCGTGAAWTRFETSSNDRRGRLAVPMLRAKLTHRFSF